MNLPINLFCLLDTALVLTSDNFLLNFSPSIPIATPWWHFQKLSSDAIFVVDSHTFTLLIEKDGCDHQNISD